MLVIGSTDLTRFGPILTTLLLEPEGGREDLDEIPRGGRAGVAYASTSLSRGSVLLAVDS